MSTRPGPTPTMPQLTYQRLMTLKDSPGGGPSVTQSQIDSAKAAKDAADAQLEVAKQALILAKAGPRKEDIAQAEAQLRATAGATRPARASSSTTPTLKAPADGVIRSRLLEPGEIASAAKPVVLASPSSSRNGCAPTSPSRTCPRSRRAPRRPSRSTATAQQLQRPYRLHLAGGGVHAARHPDGGAAHQPRLRGAHPGRRSGRRAAPRHAGDGALRPPAKPATAANERRRSRHRRPRHPQALQARQRRDRRLRSTTSRSPSSMAG